MSIQSDKIAIAKTLLETSNKQLIQQMKAVIKAYETDLWDELSDYHKKIIAQSVKELDEGKGIPHKQVMKKYKKWLTR